MKKLLFLIGTRPEVIKMAPLLYACREKVGLLTRLCTSGQHAALLTEALAEAELSPDISFTIWGDLSQKTAECLTRFDKVLAEEKPDAILVHGDTLTAFSGALAAFYRRIPVFHIEAGLRTDDLFSPFPEELYRRVIDSIATLCFAPTKAAEARLRTEGKPQGAIHVVGNTVIDTLFSDIDPKFFSPLIIKNKRLILMTLHRRETQGKTAEAICHAVREALVGRRDTHLVIPMHPSPLVREVLSAAFAKEEDVTLLPALDRRTFRNVLFRASLVLTDSGGVSEEATALGIPTLLLRDVTERPEGVAAGVLHAVGTSPEQILAAMEDHLEHPRPRQPSSVFGDGNASARICDLIEHFFLS